MRVFFYRSPDLTAATRLVPHQVSLLSRESGRGLSIGHSRPHIAPHAPHPARRHPSLRLRHRARRRTATCAVEGRRSPTRRSTCSARSTSCPKDYALGDAEDRRRGRTRRTALVLEIAEPDAPDAAARYAKLATSPWTAAARAASRARETAALERADGEGGLCRGAARQSRNLGGSARAWPRALFGASAQASRKRSRKAAGQRFAGKPIIGLETTAQQLGYLRFAAREASQRTLLSSIVDEAEGSSAEFEAMASGLVARRRRRRSR